MAGSARKYRYLLILIDVDTAWRSLWLGHIAPKQILDGMVFASILNKA